LRPETFHSLRDFIYEKSGIFFSESKLYLLEGRLYQRLNELEIGSFEEYVAYLRRGENQNEELTQIFDLITIKETYFFRFEKQLKIFLNKLFPSLLETRKNSGLQKIRIWSAGCSTGEEVYTIAMMIKEYYNGTPTDVSLDIFGTDISHNVLDKAKNGVYSTNSFRGSMPTHYKSKYFKTNGQYSEICEDLKQNVVFKYLNLSDEDEIRTVGKIDFIFCRNVLIYFDETTKRQVISGFYDVLNPNGYLFLGEAESLYGFSSAFKVEHFPGAFLYKKE